MTSAAILPSELERARLAELRAYDVLDSDPEQPYDGLVRLAARLLDVPMALVSLIDADRQWFKARLGIDSCETSLDVSFCKYAVLEDAAVVVPDARLDPRFARMANVTGAPFVRAYAGMPLRARSGAVLGTLCVVDRVVRHFSTEDLAVLADLAEQVARLLEMRLRERELAAELRRRQQAEIALAAARDEALGATRAKSAFLAAASHEIRTPLNGILGTLELLAGEPLHGRQREYVEVGQRSAQALLALLNDVLDLSKGEAVGLDGTLVLSEAAFDPAAVVQDVVEALASQAACKGIRLTAALPENSSAVLGDERRFRQVLMNLAGNAVKFTAAGGVDLSLSTEAGAAGRLRVQVAVRDTGPGLTEEEAEHVFEPFRQGRAGAEHGGTGLGLALSRQLMTLMNGHVRLTSTPGVGSTFTLSADLPVAPAGALAAPRPAPAALCRVMGAPRVLVADDSPVNLLVATALLESVGARADAVASGSAAVEAVAAAPGTYDVVLLDLAMPGMSGAEAAERIRRLPGAAGQVRLVALTASVTEEARATCAAAGMDGFLAKPVSAEDLRRLLTG